MAWAMQVEQHKAMHFARSQARRIGLWKPELPAALMAAVTDAEVARPDNALATLSGCMGQLPDGDRQLVQLCWATGFPVRQMAVDLGQ